MTNATFSLCRRARRPNCVIDGDTILYKGTRLRLQDINAPETSRPGCASEEALGHRATLRLLELVNAAPFEIVHVGGRDEDQYGRKLRIIERDEQSLGAILVFEGLARLWSGRRRSWCD